MEPYDPWNTDPLRQPPQQQTYKGFVGTLKANYNSSTLFMTP